MKDLLIVVDMQNDFIDGALGTAEAKAILPRVRDLVSSYDPKDVFFTRDTHHESYLETQEGRNLPVEHCIKGTEGWQIHPELEGLRRNEPVDKPAFGSWQLGEMLREINDEESHIESIRLAGVCTDICVISNALLLKAVLPEAKIIVDASACAGVSPESHTTALEAMKACQVIVENEG